MREFKVTEKDIESVIITEQYARIGFKTTVCALILNTGFEVIGSSAPVDPATFDFVIGKKLAREKAIEQVWEYLGAITSFQKALHDEEQARRKAEEEKFNQENIPVEPPLADNKPSMEVVPPQ